MQDVIDYITSRMDRQIELHHLSEKYQYTGEELQVIEALATLLYNAGDRAVSIKMAMSNLDTKYELDKIDGKI